MTLSNVTPSIMTQHNDIMTPSKNDVQKNDTQHKDTAQ
jgi:hypothetical protein